ncbi:transcriptional regulator, AraC family [Cytophaga hutchinsonii ATCC 33406]|uniref:Transcriptional regulator, AraC family n=1 Tax=Cytophaga hutchinsonii (strain ATCC 33406 / DSM 1761 / CIP 103989 / NBRC 15051 / NCIMB 9469 / D465) TaxID=269798 RepID=A0A6N4SVR6_CYTH3|nr:transcriptional regulator, AraC family [Cytophaga hutchinsonii ATCC 33406]SFX89713.1 transcriptional regulator, AraC family [Cytophaga hutchinsonii ATCC 33406]
MKEYFYKKRFRIQFIAVITFLLISCFAAFLVERKETINLLDSKEYIIEPFSDVWDGGYSETKIISRTNNALTFSCCLKKGLMYPYAGIHIRKTDSTFFSLKNYTLKMHLYSQEKQRLAIRIYNFNKGIHDSTVRNSFPLYHNIYIVEKAENKLKIAFDSFTTIPEWWYANNHIAESDIKSWDKDSVGYISVFSDPGFIINKERVFKITQLELAGDYSSLYRVLALFVSTVLIVFIGIHSILYQKQKRIQLTVKYSEDFDFETKDEDLKSQIHAFISENYANSELKASDLANQLHVPEYKIGEILKENVGMTFKSFLNHTRVEAAKLYLKNSSYSISEIAYKTGFNSPSSFNRVFKEIVKQAPGEFKN